jgi:hypothetical protein
MVSVLERPPGWLRAGEARRMLLGEDGAEELPSEEFCARMLARFCRVAAKAPDPLLAVSYHEMPHMVWEEVGPAFGLEISDRERRGMLDVGRLDTKRVRQDRDFVPDTVAKQRRSSATVRALARSSRPRSKS